ncbi:hybrid sensor histidine kinase/response regulator [Nitrospirillum sp. BR 11163]|uniref:hybrid sensor histidine kinase/response regulator n=1 Tax=Nitrospirillum sp. BR 11163 TaxID=3104323 RepID=UPI002AFFF750|nr:ATP-binding protein [Nitrospirillum sp. BR 11163]MEA1676085.1 ATP-binding protein [Nitrospirillum sp. BR 11163]
MSLAPGGLMLLVGAPLLLMVLCLAAALAWGVLDHPLSLMVAVIAAGAFLLAALLGLYWLRQAAARAAVLRAVVEAVPDALAVAGEDGRVLVANGAFSALAHAAGSARVADILAHHCREGADTQRLRDLDGAVRRGEGGEAFVVFVDDAPGQPAGGVARPVPRLVAARPLAADRPGLSEWRVRSGGAVPVPGSHPWRELWDLAPLGVMLVDGSGTLLRVNLTLADWLGHTRDLLEDGSRHLRDLLATPPQGELFPERLAGMAEVELAAARAAPLRASVLHVASSPGGSLVFLGDLTRETAREEELRRAEQRFQRFFQFAPTGFAFVDGEFRLAECNPTFLTMADLRLGDVQGEPIASLFQPEHRANLLARLGEVLEGRQPAGAAGGMGTPVEARLRGASGAVVHVYSRRFDGEGDGDRGLILHLVDMTAQKNLEAQFVQSQKMQAIGQLAGGVAHDFNNLLTAMIGFCDLLLLRHKPGDQSFSDIMQIKQNANRAANLVRQLLAFSRQQTLQPRVLSITDVLAELSNLLRRLIGENIELRMLHGRDTGLVRVDQGQLEQVIINLAVNARDAMPKGGRLTIVTGNLHTTEPIRHETEEMPPGDWVVVEVIDTGIGIPPENLQRIFEPFFSTKEVGSGTGLGLSTVYGIVRQTGGFVFVESKPGEGAKFSIHLPRLDDKAAQAAPAEEARDKAAADLTGMGTVLLVEDEDAVRVFGARALRNKGYTVLEARSGEEALDLLQGERGGDVDLIVSDVVMPQMDGPTMIEQVRRFRPDVKVIFISGYAEDRFRHSLKDGAVVDFLPKPFSLKQLAAKVKEVMEGAPRTGA